MSPEIISEQMSFVGGKTDDTEVAAFPITLVQLGKLITDTLENACLEVPQVVMSLTKIML